MSVQTVMDYLKAFGKEGDVREFEVSSATVQLAAEALGVEPARIAKTLSFEMEDGCLLVVAAGDAKIDNPKFKAAFGRKATMLSPDRVLALTGHAVGGVCPFALPEGVRVVLDVSLRRFGTIFPAAGSSSSAIELTCGELETLSGSREWLDVCKGWQEE